MSNKIYSVNEGGYYIGANHPDSEVLFLVKVMDIYDRPVYTGFTSDHNQIINYKAVNSPLMSNLPLNRFCERYKPVPKEIVELIKAKEMECKLNLYQVKAEDSDPMIVYAHNAEQALSLATASLKQEPSKICISLISLKEPTVIKNVAI